MKKIYFIPITCLALNAFAWETDNFTSRRKILNEDEQTKIDNLYSLNDKMNKEIRNVLNDFSESGYDCTEDIKKIKQRKVPKVFSWIDDRLGGTHAVIEEYAESDNVKMYDHNRSWVTMKSNLYGKNYGLQGAFNLDGHVVGPDKVGHFVDQGFDLVEVFISGGSNEESFKEAMYESNDMEEGMFGLFASDVKSYGDMGANMSGLSFYYNLLSGENPQLSCDPTTKKYSMNYDFNWSEYVNDSWDEGTNCSFFESVENPYKRSSKSSSSISKVYPPANSDEKQFIQNLKNMKPPLSCPDSKDSCKEIASKNCANYFVSPRCIRAVDVKPKCDSKNFDKLFKVSRVNNYKYDRENKEDTNEKPSHISR